MNQFAAWPIPAYGESGDRGLVHEEDSGVLIKLYSESPGHLPEFTGAQ